MSGIPEPANCSASIINISMKDIRDAFVLLFLANIAALIGAALTSYADLLPIPLMLALYSASGTFLLATVGLFTLAIISAVAGYKGLKSHD